MESESPSERHEEPARVSSPTVSLVSPVSPMPATPAVPVTPAVPKEPKEPKGTLVVDLEPRPVPVEAKSSLSHSLSSQKKVQSIVLSDV